MFGKTTVTRQGLSNTPLPDLWAAADREQIPPEAHQKRLDTQPRADEGAKRPVGLSEDRSRRARSALDQEIRCAKPHTPVVAKQRSFETQL